MVCDRDIGSPSEVTKVILKSFVFRSARFSNVNYLIFDAMGEINCFANHFEVISLEIKKKYFTDYSIILHNILLFYYYLV